MLEVALALRNHPVRGLVVAQTLGGLIARVPSAHPVVVVCGKLHAGPITLRATIVRRRSCACLACGSGLPRFDMARKASA